MTKAEIIRIAIRMLVSRIEIELFIAWLIIRDDEE